MTKIAVDLFSGTGSATKAFRESNDWKVFDVELNPNKDFDTDRIDLEKDIMDVNPEELPNKVDFVWASPPCKAFSVASIGYHWEKDSDKYIPQTEFAKKSIELVKHTLDLIDEINPEYWFLENPRAMMRKILNQEIGIWPEGTVTYCQYGDNRMKPTDLWGDHPENFDYKSCSNGGDCHESAPRGSNKGTQGMKSAKVRGMIPYGLSKEIFDAVENPGKYKKQQS